MLKLPWRRRRVSRGQALVEFALILPILALLMVMSVDFGRVFFGWVGLNNSARIGANFAAGHADAWKAPDSPIKQQQRNDYFDQIADDAQAVNCTVPDYDGDGQTNVTNGRAELIQDLKAAPSPAVQPVFTNLTGTADPHEMGDQVSVRLTCNFAVITPLASQVLGGGVTIGATSIFLVRSGAISGIPAPSGSPTPTPAPANCTVPNFVGGKANNADATWAGANFTGPVTKVGNGNFTIAAQSLPATSSQPCTSGITVFDVAPTPTPVPTPTPSICQPPVANFTATPTSGKHPLTVQFTDISFGNGCTIITWAWDFDNNGTVDSTLKNPSHKYNQTGTYSIKLTVTTTGGSSSILQPGYVVVN